MWMNSEQLTSHNKSQTRPYTWDNAPALLMTATPQRELRLAMKTSQLAPPEPARAAFFFSGCDGTLLDTQTPVVPGYISECLALLPFMCQTPQSGQAERDRTVPSSESPVLDYFSSIKENSKQDSTLQGHIQPNGITVHFKNSKALYLNINHNNHTSCYYIHGNDACAELSALV